MEAALPPTPGRGRSRFSKALPDAPSPPPVPSRRPKSPAASALSVKTAYSALPPLPKPSVPKMSIPRRPVGGGGGGVAGNVGGSAGGGGAVSVAQTNPNPNQPRASISSLSSVYSDSPGFRESDAVETPTTYTQEDSDSGMGELPPLPAKDNNNHNQRSPPLADSPTTPPNNNNIIGSPQSGFQSSSPRTELWRRRSVRSDKSINFSELKLQKSNGSTAAPPSRAPERSLPSLPRTNTARKPVPSRPAPPQPQTDLMGAKISKLKKKLSSEEYDPFKGEVAKLQQSTQQPQPQQQPLPPTFNRLPTPEYRKTDRQQPLTPQVLSPISPETPPQDVKAPEVPQKSQSRGASSESTLHAEPQPHLLQENHRPNLLLSHSRDSSETLTITSEPRVVRSPQPKKPVARVVLTPEPPMSPDLTSPLSLPSPVGTQAIDIKFPVYPGGALTANTIVPGPSLSVTHFECYQQHKFMRNSRNTICPVACMICEKKDAEARWKCNWCCLRCCATCMQALTSVPDKDLRLCLEKIGRKGMMAS